MNLMSGKFAIRREREMKRTIDKSIENLFWEFVNLFFGKKGLYYMENLKRELR